MNLSMLRNPRSLIVFVMLTTQAMAYSRITDSVTEVVLDNGMRVLMVYKEGRPNIAAGWVAHVGSANERPGITGISHLFEHMMFKGSQRIGTSDFAKDRDIRARLDAVRDAMFEKERDYRELVRHGKGDSIDDPALQGEEMEALKARFDALIQEQRGTMVKDEFDQIYTESGATGMNAFTNRDMTVYFIKVPRNKLELWFWMESERLNQPVFREFYSERDVVYEERRMRTDSTPTGKQDEVFDSLFWRGHPYGWPVIGWPSDISAITRAQAEEFFGLYYAPGNITAALVGEFDIDHATELAESYFGRIPSSSQPPPDVITLAMPQAGELFYRASLEAPPEAVLRYHTTAFDGEDDPALQVLAEVLSSKTGPLYRRLVLEEQIAVQVGAGQNGGKYDGSFSLYATGKESADPERLREMLLHEVALIQQHGVADSELQKVKNRLAAAKYRRLRSPFGLLVQLLYYDGLRDWRVMDSYMERLIDVDVAALQRVAKNYLVADNRANKLYRRAQSRLETGS